MARLNLGPVAEPITTTPRAKLHRSTDPAAWAESTLLVAQVDAQHVREYAAVIVALTKRIDKGRVWLTAHPTDNRALVKLLALESDRAEARLACRHWALVCWDHVCQTFGFRKNGGIATVDRDTMWRELLGDLPVPDEEVIVGQATVEWRLPPIADWEIEQYERLTLPAAMVAPETRTEETA